MDIIMSNTKKKRHDIKTIIISIFLLLVCVVSIIYFTGPLRSEFKPPSLYYCTPFRSEVNPILGSYSWTNKGKHFEHTDQKLLKELKNTIPIETPANEPLGVYLSSFNGSSSYSFHYERYDFYIENVKIYNANDELVYSYKPSHTTPSISQNIIAPPYVGTYSYILSMNFMEKGVAEYGVRISSSDLYYNHFRSARHKMTSMNLLKLDALFNGLTDTFSFFNIDDYEVKQADEKSSVTINCTLSNMLKTDGNFEKVRNICKSHTLYLFYCALDLDKINFNFSNKTSYNCTYTRSQLENEFGSLSFMSNTQKPLNDILCNYWKSKY